MASAGALFSRNALPQVLLQPTGNGCIDPDQCMKGAALDICQRQWRGAMPMPSAQDQYHRSWLARLLSQYHHRARKLLARACRRPTPDDHAATAPEFPYVPRYSYDASLLFRRMALVQIDRDELARDEPLLLRELQGFCTLCGSKRQCVRDMQRESETGEPRDWREYCPNAATLNALGALQNCPRAAQYLKTPHASRLPLPDNGGRHG
jgi:hypothetical protein